MPLKRIVGRSVMSSVLVLGGGPAGLAAGCYLSQNSTRSTILEKEDYVGGLCHTIEHNGFRFDIGGHRWFTKEPEVDRWVKGLMGDEFIPVDRRSRIYYQGRFFDYPLKLGNVLRGAGMRGSCEALLSYLVSHFKRGAPLTMEDAYIKQFGRKLYEMFFEGYSEKVWGRPCTMLSPDWVEQRTKGFSILGAATKMLFPSTKVISLAENFHYPRTGYQRISERMAEEIVKHSGSVRLNTRVRRLEVKHQRIERVIVENPDGEEECLYPDTVISSIPVTLLVKQLDLAPPDYVLEAAAKLQFRDLITANIELDQERVTSDTWIYVQDAAIPFGRLHEPKNWSPQMAPAGKTSLVAEFFCSIGDDLWKQTNESICQTAIHHLSRDLGFIDETKVISSFAFRAARAYPVYTLDYLQNLNYIKNYLAKIENLQIIGRGGSFRYNNSDHSIEMGIASAKNVLGGDCKIDYVNSAREYLEEVRIG